MKKLATFCIGLSFLSLSCSAESVNTPSTNPEQAAGVKAELVNGDLKNPWGNGLFA